MGNASALPYDILEQVDYRSNNHWQLSKGAQKVISRHLQYSSSSFLTRFDVENRKEQSRRCQYSDL